MTFNCLSALNCTPGLQYSYWDCRALKGTYESGELKPALRLLKTEQPYKRQIKVWNSSAGKWTLCQTKLLTEALMPS